MMSLLFLLFAVFMLHACAEHALNHGFEETEDGMPRFLSAVDSQGWTAAAIIAAVVGFANYFAPKCNSLAIAILCWIAVLAVIAYEVRYFAQYGDQLREAVPFLLILIPMTLTFRATAAAVQENANGSLGLWWNALNTAIVIAAFAIIIILLLQRRYTETENGAFKAGAIIALILAIAMILGAFAGGHFFKKGSGDTADDDTPEIAETWYRFHCYDTGDFQFGPPANPDGTAEGAKAEHYARIEKDPALGAATFANFDVRLGTDFLEPGYHYDQHQSDGQWTTRINEKVRYYLANQEEYAKAVKRWKTFVDKYASVELNYRTGLKDQMYAVSYGNIDEPPQIIVAETDQPDGDILEYVFLIKGNEFRVPFRTDCGDQPTDVGEIMKETPQANPVKTKAKAPAAKNSKSTKSTSTSTTPASKTSGGNSQTSKISGGDSTSTVIPPIRIGGRTITGGKSGGSGGRGGSGGGGGSSSSTKDPTKGTAVGGNDTSGPGPDTNNGVGSRYSSAEEPTNSAFIKPITGGGESKSAYDVYEDRIEDLNETNATQKVGGDANTPSYKVGSGSKSSGGSSSSSSSTSSGSSSSSGGTEDRVTIHSNADKGNGYGGVDQQPSTEKTSSSGVEKALKSDDASKNTEMSMPD